MITLRQIHIPTQRQSAALSARERLLGDSTMRRNQPDYSADQHPPAPPITVTYETVSGSDLCAPPTLFTRSEQERRAIQIARSFKHHYLSEMAHHDRKQLVVAILRPVGTRSAPLRISVDPDGNVNVTPLRFAPDGPCWRAAAHFLLTRSMLAAFAVSLLLILSLLI